MYDDRMERPQRQFNYYDDFSTRGPPYAPHRQRQYETIDTSYQPQYAPTALPSQQQQRSATLETLLPAPRYQTPEDNQLPRLRTNVDAVSFPDLRDIGNSSPIRDDIPIQTVLDSFEQWLRREL